MSICSECGERRVLCVSRQLCGRCYQQKRKRGELYEIPIDERLVNKYGPSIIDDLERLKTDPTTLTALGDKYGFTREYARQLFFRVFGYRYTGFRKAKAQRRKIDKVVHRRSPIEKIKRYKPGGGPHKGAIGEAVAYGVCDSLGYDITSGIGHSTVYDLIINGHKCDVKTSYKTLQTNPTACPYYRFSISQKQKAEVEYFVLYVMPLGVSFVVPGKEIPGPSVYIPPSLDRINKSRFSKYREAWHLLMRPLRQINMEACHG